MTFGLKPEGEYATSPLICGGKDNWKSSVLQKLDTLVRFQAAAPLIRKDYYMQYLIEEKDLIELLSNSLRLEALERDGVDNWTWYGDGFRDFLKEIAEENGVTLEEDSDFSFQDAAQLIIKLKYDVLDAYYVNKYLRNIT